MHVHCACCDGVIVVLGTDLQRGAGLCLWSQGKLLSSVRLVLSPVLVLLTGLIPLAAPASHLGNLEDRIWMRSVG